MTEMRKCRVSGEEFEVTDMDLAFYERIGVPVPTLCPEERQRRRLVWRNERHLYKRECGKCGKGVVAIYPGECKFPIYCEGCFWGDGWSPLDYGRDYDFERPFFEQFQELLDEVPRLAITNMQSENSDYTLNSIGNKSCYLTSGADYNEDHLYGINSQRVKDCVDTFFIFDSELCYGCMDSEHLYNCVGCQDCENVQDSWFLYDCKGCKNCAFSANLRHKQYVLLGEQLSKEEYEARLPQVLGKLHKFAHWVEVGRKEVRKKAFHKAVRMVNCENVRGNYVKNSRNCDHVFDSEKLEDCRYMYFGLDTKDSTDVSAIGFESSLIYEAMSVGYVYEVMFGAGVYFSRNANYCVTCWHVQNVFGGVSLHGHEKFVILNKQYSEEDYRALVQKITNGAPAKWEATEGSEFCGEEERLRPKVSGFELANSGMTGLRQATWGEFFPPGLAPFEYNRSAAMDYMPLSREEALAKGFRWHDDTEERAFDGLGVSGKVFERIEDVPDAVLEQLLRCERCNRNYKVVKQELSFYRRRGLPLPRLCWHCRLRGMIDARAEHCLRDGKCGECGDEVKTVYDEGEKIYCEKCYEIEVNG